MDMFDNLRDKLLSYFNTNDETSGGWIKINDDESGLTIENFPDGVGDHCWKCVTVNQCWFKDEENKKPKPFDYSKYKLVPNKGLYHFFCHCEEKTINVPKKI